jgi:hypothetical protein
MIFSNALKNSTLIMESITMKSMHSENRFFTQNGTLNQIERKEERDSQ